MSPQITAEKKNIMELAESEPIVNACLKMYHMSELTYEEALEKMVVAFAKANNDILQKYITLAESGFGFGGVITAKANNDILQEQITPACDDMSGIINYEENI